MVVPRRHYDLVSLPPPGNAADFREQVRRAEEERSALRDGELEAQASPVRDPRERIEIWERLHALRLPRAHDHVLVKVIARQTRLTVGQVHEEQRRRAEVPASLAQPGVASAEGELSKASVL
jgi:hypothetical protein